ncbi:MULTISPECIES: D-alanine--D-alanine ligase [Halomonadaceae]|uniref:D-alanine--D-alanine ligase n=1 Tax=Halomonadaceae TaxID=28256 RepID=UPI002648929D|nr:D-alanine--D-alanine ligase [Halomonas sp. KG2]WKD27055.1 D-alanine--D-alanine ligase [Halomonas sp. KG2]
MTRKPLVAVLMGGLSSERDVSLRTGEACALGLEEAGYLVERVDVQDDIAERLMQIRPDKVFNALHGPGGEDGIIQGLLELLHIPYTHSGVLASALAMHKVNAKHVAAANGIPVAEHVLATPEEISAGHVMAPPYIVKPIAEGSSFGITAVYEGDEAPSLSPDIARFGEKLMVERFVPGRELTCAVLDDGALGISEIFTQGQDFYDYESKYVAGGSRHICPAELPPEVEQRILDLSLAAHRALGCRGASRSDYRFDPERNELIWLEVNTQPGMTQTSLLPEIAQMRGISFSQLVAGLIEDASLNR